MLPFSMYSVDLGAVWDRVAPVDDPASGTSSTQTGALFEDKDLAENSSLRVRASGRFEKGEHVYVPCRSRIIQPHT